MKRYDFIIAGAGGAGLGLALQLLDSSFKNHSILLVDRDTKQKDDRTWCFWGDQETACTDIAKYAWENMTIRSESFHKKINLTKDIKPGWKYWMVSSLDFYNHALDRIKQAQNVDFILGEIEKVESNKEKASLWVNGEEYQADWLFNSIIKPGDIVIDPKKHHDLKQHFVGWQIESKQEVFDPETVTMFDFDTPQPDGLHFFYILPFSKSEALIEYTIFSHHLLTQADYEEKLQEYIESKLAIHSYTIVSKERGVIPMTDYPFQRKAGKRIMNIGTLGGLVKPSTGYAFKRMQRDAKAIVESLEKYGNPFLIKKSSFRYKIYDSLLLQILYRQSAIMKTIFTQLFQNNPIARIFRFLDEDATVIEDLILMASVSPTPFLKAIIRLYILRKI